MEVPLPLYGSFKQKSRLKEGRDRDLLVATHYRAGTSRRQSDFCANWP